MLGALGSSVAGGAAAALHRRIVRRRLPIPLVFVGSALATVLLGAGPALTEPSPEPSPTATAVTSARVPAGKQRDAMVKILAAQTSRDRKAWFVIGPDDPETQALATGLRAAFEQAGWKADIRTVPGMVPTPGIAMLAAEEEPPLWVGSVQKALDASGLQVKYGIGYRSTYEEKKKEDSGWVGVPIEPNQAFVIVIGPVPGA
jgi:hypothetical protein